MATLRRDVEGTELPISNFKRSAPWPPVDPDAFSPEIRRKFNQQSRIITTIKYLLGLTRTDKQRTLYNAARPFEVIGGVSEREMVMLRNARGSMAKVGLTKLWFVDFLSRETLAGSFGKVAPPILSRLYQYMSDAMLGYHQARKIAFIPFPFPHAQLTSLFIIVMMILMPLLVLSFTDDIVTASVLNFFCVVCFSGLHEVALILEKPFQNAPNDIPLNRFQAMFNEALLVTFNGNHPDAWWAAPPLDGNQKGI